MTGSETFTYRTLDRVVTERARMFEEAGVRAGTVVSLVAVPGPESILRLLGLWRLGAIVAPVHHRATEVEQRRVRETASRLDEAGGAVLPEGARAIVWTSGTSGRPKGVVLSDRTFTANAEASADRLGLTTEDVWGTSLSLAHVGGLALVARAFLLGSAVRAVEPGEEELEAVTHVSLVPTQLRRLSASGDGPTPSLRCALIGGAHTPKNLLARALEDGWPLALTYGATEMGSQIATAPPELTARKPGTVGAPIGGVEIGFGSDGEVLARGPTQAMGVVRLNRRQAVEPALEPIVDADGWYRTGDYGRLDEEGHLWITGRRGDRVVTGGTTVHSVEVEEVLRRHPDVADACVVGVADAEWGEIVAAWIEPTPKGCELGALERYVAEVLSPPKRPRRWHVGGRVPSNPNGKPDRSAVRRVLEQAR